MKTIDWQTEYTTYDGYNITASAIYVSVTGSLTSGNGSRERPYSPVKQIDLGNSNTLKSIVIGGGVVDLTATNNGSLSLIGQSKESTIIRSLSFADRTLQLKDLTFETVKSSHLWATNCIFKEMFNLDLNYNTDSNIMNCIFYGKPAILKFNNAVMTSRSTFVKSPVLSTIFKSPTPLLVQADVFIDQLTLANYTNYMAFNGCKFNIGMEGTSTALVGSNAAELRSNFVNRCVAQGFTVPTIDEYGDAVSVGRWIFSNTSIIGDYNTLQDSEIDVFAKSRGIYFGHTNQTIKQIPITTTANIPASFSQIPEACSQTLVQNDSIGLLSNSDFTKRINAYADSKIIWLGGLSKLTTLSLTHNLPIEAGVCPDSVYGLTLESNKTIEAGNHYIVRSKDDSLATIRYNNVEYTSSLITRKNVFLGVAGITTFEDLNGNAEVHQVLDFANHSSVQIRLMREIPTGNITSGNLQAGYWYFVEPDSLTDTSGSITYKGIVRPAFDSFLVDASNLTFSARNKVHLRRCWKQDFNFETETTDKSFWDGRQKPNYFDVIPNDLRCLLKNNSSASVELESAAGAYIGSGHPDFYNRVNGVNGLKLPAYNIVGSYLQIRVPITTINPM